MDINENIIDHDKERQKRYQKEKLAMYLSTEWVTILCLLFLWQFTLPL